MAETIVRNGLFFDGRGTAPDRKDLRIADGVLLEVSDAPLEARAGERVIDAEGCWVVPGFIDIHTHYDAELEMNPALDESLRHGVTTVFIGSCSLSAAVGEPDDIADMFTRVEAIPDGFLRPLLRARKDWRTHAEYAAHLDALPLGPNVSSFVGYSAVRAHVLGLSRSLDPRVRPTRDELDRMEASLEEAYDAGFLGLSLNSLHWDKMGGDRFRGEHLPSTNASWRELRRMVRGARRRGLNLQALPNVAQRYDLLFYAAFSMGFGLRNALKTSIVSIMDLRANRFVWRLLQGLGWAFNRLGGARLRFQLLPVTFDLWADGFENALFEEFGAGAAGLQLQSLAERRALFREPGYRSWFRRQWYSPFVPRVYHRNFAFATVKECPDDEVVGLTFRDVGRRRGVSEVEAFLDLVAEHGPALRWYTVMGNDRPRPLARMLRGAHNIIGFSDAGAHLRNMAFYNYPLRMLRFVKEAAERGTPVMPLERAVQRLTGELGEWFDIDAGTLEVGRRADLAVIDPDGLDGRLDEMHEAPMMGLDGFQRLVRRNPDAVRAVFVGGQQVVEAGEVLPGVGTDIGPGRFLPVRSSGPRREPRRPRKLLPPSPPQLLPSNP